MTESTQINPEAKNLKREYQEQRRMGARRPKVFLWGTLAVVLGLLIVGGIWFMKGQTKQPTGVLELGPNEHIKGNANAPVTLVEYADFQCPACSVYYSVTKQLAQDFPQDLKIVFRHFPLTQAHANAFPAARAAEAASRQGKFWEMHNILFEHQDEWAKSTNAADLFVGYAREIGLDENRFKSDFQDPSIDKKIQDDYHSGIQLGIPGTPSFFLNGKFLNNPRSYDEFKQLVSDAIAAAKK